MFAASKTRCQRKMALLPRQVCAICLYFLKAFRRGEKISLRYFKLSQTYFKISQR